MEREEVAVWREGPGHEESEFQGLKLNAEISVKQTVQDLFF